MSSVENFHDCKDAFLYLHIISPADSYDMNMEPAKDDVLFADADFIIVKLERFLSCVYGELQTPNVASRSKVNSKPGGYELLYWQGSRGQLSPCFGPQNFQGTSKIYHSGEHIHDRHDYHSIRRNIKISNP